MRAAAIIVIVAVALGWGVLGFPVPLAHADTPTTIIIAIPKNVTIDVGAHQIHFIGRATSTSAVNCAPGTPQPQTVVAVDPGGGSASQITGVLAFHAHEIPLGARYRITAGPDVCSPDLSLYTAELE